MLPLQTSSTIRTFLRSSDEARRAARLLNRPGGSTSDDGSSPAYWKDTRASPGRRCRPRSPEAEDLAERPRRLRSPSHRQWGSYPKPTIGTLQRYAGQEHKGGARAVGCCPYALEGGPSQAGTWPLLGIQDSLQRAIEEEMIISGMTTRHPATLTSAETSGLPSRCQSPSGTPTAGHVPSSSPPSKLIQRMAIGRGLTWRLIGVERSSSCGIGSPVRRVCPEEKYNAAYAMRTVL
jgi:hypothetical protein